LQGRKKLLRISQNAYRGKDTPKLGPVLLSGTCASALQSVVSLLAHEQGCHNNWQQNEQRHRQQNRCFIAICEKLVKVYICLNDTKMVLHTINKGNVADKRQNIIFVTKMSMIFFRSHAGEWCNLQLCTMGDPVVTGGL
jgi:hypothetical protein